MARKWVVALCLALCLALASCTVGQPEAPGDATPAATVAHVIAAVEIGRSYSIAAGPTGIWSANYEDGEVVLVDPELNEVIEKVRVKNRLGAGASYVYPVGDHVWLSAGDSATIGHLDPRTMQLEVAVDASPGGFLDMAASEGEVFLAQYSASRQIAPRTVRGVRIASANRAASPRADGGGRFAIYSDIAAGDAGIWALGESEGTLAAISGSVEAPRIVARREEAFIGGYGDVAVGHGYVWVMTSNGGSSRLARFDPATFDIDVVTIEGESARVAFGPTSVWVLTNDDDRGLIWEVDPKTLSRPERPVELEGEFGSGAIAYGFDSIWVSHDFNLLTRLATTPDAGSVAAPTPLRRGDGDICDSSGPWSDCPAATWLYRVIKDAGFTITGDTGTALQIEADGGALYAWNVTAREPIAAVAERDGLQPTAAGAYAGRQRLVWEAQGFHIYLEPATEQGVDQVDDDTVERLVRSSRSVATEADFSGAKPQPEPTADQRFEDLGNGRVRVWPVTEDVPNEGKYLFTAPHCGIDWMIDFDGSFWDPVKPEDYGNGERYPFFINADEGVITFTHDDRAVYQASNGTEIQLRRLKGPIDIHPCE